MSKKMVTPPKKAKDLWNRRVKSGQMFRRPSAWKKWKPGRQRGLGLGKLVTGLLQAGTHQDNKEMHDKLDYVARGDSLGDSFSRFATDDYEPIHEWETFKETEDIQDFKDYSNVDIFNVLKSDDQTEIRKMLASMGIEDIGGEYSDFIKGGLFDLPSAYNKAYLKATAPIRQKWEEAGASLQNMKRYGNVFGTGEETEDNVLKMFDQLESQYGDTDKQVMSQVVNEALSAITGSE